MAKRKAKVDPITGEPITAAWEATFSIEAAAPNPSASLDVPDSAGGKDKPGPVGHMAGDNQGKPPIPRFVMAAYNGGPMNLTGWKYPVVVDGRGIKAASKNIPIYVYHLSDSDTPSERIKQLMGQSDTFAVYEETGQITACGPITGESELVCDAMKHAKNGFKWQASIGARTMVCEFVKEGQIQLVNGREINGPAVVARAIICDHIALVPLGADSTTSATLAASAAESENHMNMEFAAWLKAEYGLEADKLTAEQKAKLEAQFNAGEPAQKPNVTADIRAEAAAEMSRIAAINAEAKDFADIAAKAISEGWTIDKTKYAVLEAKFAAAKTAGPAIHASASAMPKDGLLRSNRSAYRGGRHVGNGRLSDDHAAVVEAAGLISAGYSADKLAKDASYGQRTVEVAEATMNKFGTGLGPAGLMRLAAEMAGVSLPTSNSDPRFIDTIKAEFTTLNLPVILSNLMNKQLLESYTAVDPDVAANDGSVAWQKFVRRGPVNDFKPHYRVRLAGDMQLKDLGPTGEIEHAKAGEQSYLLQAKTKAIMFGISREQIINDDLSAMTTVPTQFGRGAGITVAKAIYAALIAGLQSDKSTAFFTSSDVTTAGNLMKANLLTSSALSFTTLEAAKAQMDIQTDPMGLPAGVYPEILLVPPQIANLARQLMKSEVLISSLASGGNARGVPAQNTLAGMFKPVSSAYLSSLTSGSASTWYLLAGPQQAAYAIEAGFLNGQEMPIVERADASFDTLGVQFRGFLDFGVSLIEPRAAVKCTA